MPAGWMWLILSRSGTQLHVSDLRSSHMHERHYQLKAPCHLLFWEAKDPKTESQKQGSSTHTRCKMQI